MKNIIFVLIIIFLFSGCKIWIGTFGSRELNNLEQAEELLRQEKWGAAIEKYQAHIVLRNKDKNRPSWENPYFYKLLIGDVELRRGEISNALAAYEEAEKAGIELNLISDRYRGVAYWYEAKGKLHKALEILTRYRDRDPMLFDAVADRLAKESILREEQDSHKP